MSWIEMPSGRRVNMLDVQPDDLDIHDIAHTLGNICRWGGRTRYHYSVAQHSVALALHFDDNADLARTALMHDAAEALIGDMVRPLKNLHEMTAFRDIEDRINRVLAKRFGTLYPFPVVLDHADCDIAGLEGQILVSGFQRSLPADRPVTEFGPAVTNHLRHRCAHGEEAALIFMCHASRLGAA